MTVRADEPYDVIKSFKFKKICREDGTVDIDKSRFDKEETPDIPVKVMAAAKELAKFANSKDEYDWPDWKFYQPNRRISATSLSIIAIPRCNLAEESVLNMIADKMMQVCCEEDMVRRVALMAEGQELLEEVHVEAKRFAAASKISAEIDESLREALQQVQQDELQEKTKEKSTQTAEEEVDVEQQTQSFDNENASQSIIAAYSSEEEEEKADNPA